MKPIGVDELLAAANRSGMFTDRDFTSPTTVAFKKVARVTSTFNYNQNIA